MKIVKKNGITLISLVITIIVLIILASITINLLIGESGIITKAKEAKINTEISIIEEAIEMAKVNNIENDGTLNVEAFKMEVSGIKGVDEVEIIGNIIVIRYKSLEKQIEVSGRIELSEEELIKKAEKLIKEQKEEKWVIGIDSWGNEVNMNLWAYTYMTEGGWNLNGSQNPETDYTSGYLDSGIKNGTIQGEIPAYIAVKANGIITKDLVRGMMYTFAGLTELQTLPDDLHIPQNVQYLKGMLMFCTNLQKTPEHMSIPGKCSDMSLLFAECSNLKQVPTLAIPQSCTTTYKMFAGCSLLEKIPDNFSLPDSVKNINEMFTGCISLSQISDYFSIPKDVTSISYLFYNCKNLKIITDRFLIPESVADISYAFASCESLEGKVVLQGSPTIYEGAFYELGYKGNGFKLYVPEKFSKIRDLENLVNNFEKIAIEPYITAKTVGDNITLYAKIVASGANQLNINKNWIIMAHGFNMNKEEYEKEIASKLLGTGYNLLIIDQRGHGESNAKPTTLGWLEGKDLVDWANYITQINPSANIVLFGQSMGGTAVSVASGETLPTNVVGIIEDSGFTSIKNIQEYTNQSDVIESSFKEKINNSVEWMKQAYADEDLLNTSVLTQVAKCKLSMLFLHGSDDILVPTNMCDELYNAAILASNRQKYISEGLGHCIGIYSDPQYASVFSDFVQRLKK